MTDPKRQEVSLDEEDEFEEFQVEGKAHALLNGVGPLLCSRNRPNNNHRK